MSSDTEALPVWIDGEIRRRTDPVLRGDDSAAVEGRGCYTTARVVDGQPCWIERHIRRLSRDAQTLGLGLVEPEQATRALRETAHAAFGHGDGAVRLQASRDGGGGLHLLAIPRQLGPEPDVWRAIGAVGAHPGPMPWGGVKVTNHLPMGWARSEATRAGVDEALLFDREGCAVEGTRCNLLFSGSDGELRAVDTRRGAVEGVALETLRDRLGNLEVADLPREQIWELDELIAVNSLRGARSIVEFDGRPVGSGRPGTWSRRLAALLDLA